MEVFVSHASLDKAIADRVVATLERVQIRCWYAPRDIRPGKPYPEAILEGLRTTRVLVVIVSAHALASADVLRELDRGSKYGLVVVPFRIENVAMSGSFEYFLSIPHWLDAHTPPLEPHLERLREVVRGILDLGTPTTVPIPPAPTREVPVAEVSPDLWSRRPGGRLRQFFDRFLQDPESS
jgi:TIR domain-containing protein